MTQSWLFNLSSLCPSRWGSTLSSVSIPLAIYSYASLQKMAASHVRVRKLCHSYYVQRRIFFLKTLPQKPYPRFGCPIMCDVCDVCLSGLSKLMCDVCYVWRVWCVFVRPLKAYVWRVWRVFVWSSGLTCDVCDVCLSGLSKLMCDVCDVCLSGPQG